MIGTGPLYDPPPNRLEDARHHNAIDAIDAMAHRVSASQPDPGQRYRLSPEAAAEVATASVYDHAQPYLRLTEDGVTLDLWTE
jgi:hypothetical protein